MVRSPTSQTINFQYIIRNPICVICMFGWYVQIILTSGSKIKLQEQRRSAARGLGGVLSKR